MTAKELETQIESLLKELKILRDSLLKIEGGKIKIEEFNLIEELEKDIESLEIEKDPMIVDYKKADKYFRELLSIGERNEKIINKSRRKKIKIFTNHPEFAQKIEKEVKDDKNYQWKIVDEHKIKKEERLLHKKYKKDILPVGGAGGPDGWIDPAVIQGLLLIFGSWFLSHILGDIDAKLWDKFKKIIIKIYRKIKPKKNSFLIVPSYHIISRDYPTIIFYIPIGLKEEIVDNALTKLPNETKRLLIRYAGREISSLTFEFKFYPKSKKWIRCDNIDKLLKKISKDKEAHF